MYHRAKRILRSATLLLAVFLVPATGSQVIDYYLWAGPTTQDLPGAAIAHMWGFALESDRNYTTLQGMPTVPGPVLTVPPGDATLVIHILNRLPEAVSVVIPGQVAAMTPARFTDSNGHSRIRSFAAEVAPGSVAVFRWSNLRPGTYLYQSGTHVAVQVQMGLYGAVTKNTSTGLAYKGIPFDTEQTLLFSEIDPVLHQAVASGNYGPDRAITSTMGYKPRYFLINGKAYPDAKLPDIQTNRRVLLRFLNAGLRSRFPLLQGPYMKLVAEDGNLYSHSRETYCIDLPAGKTHDAILNVAAPAVYPLYDRAMGLTNDKTLSGGMFVRLNVKAPVAPAKGAE